MNKMTIERLENAISNTQIDVLEKYNELKKKIEVLEKNYLTTAQDLRVRVTNLEGARLRQIEFNSDVTKKLIPPKEPEKPINKPRWSFWR